MKRILWTLLVTIAVWPWMAQAQKTGIGYELVNEVYDEPAKTYAVTIEVWSQDRDADALIITPHHGEDQLKIVNPKPKTWAGQIPKQKRYQHTVTVKNPTAETLALMIDVQRKAGKKTDKKTISIQVAPR